MRLSLLLRFLERVDDTAKFGVRSVGFTRSSPRAELLQPFTFSRMAGFLNRVGPNLGICAGVNGFSMR